MINLSKNSTPDGAAPRMMLSKIKLRSSIGAALIMRPRLRRRAWNVVIWIGCIVCGWVSGLLIPSRYIVTVFINCLPSIDRAHYWYFSSSFPSRLKIYERIHSPFQTGGISLC